MDRAAPANTDHDADSPTPQGSGCLLTRLLAGLLLTLGSLGIFSAWMVHRTILAPYETRIYPNVYVLDVNLGGLTPDEAAELVTQTLGHHDASLLTLSDGERTWTIPWTEIGLHLDVDTTVQAAFAVGRTERGLENLPTILDMLEGRHQVAPVFVIDPDEMRSALEQLAPQVFAPPTDATLHLEGDQLVAVPGQPGWALDIDATLNNIVAAVTMMGPDNQFALTFQVVPACLTDTKAAQAQAEEILNRQVHIVTYDWLTDETFVWTLDRETIITWLRVEQTQGSSSPIVWIAEEAIQATLDNLAAELGEGRGLRLEGATQRVLNIFEAGGGTVELDLMHLPHTYVVQPGDDLTTIASRVGVPPGLIAEANPDIDLNWLSVGQELTIPSEDVLKPYPPVPGKQIVISIAEQRLRVYENGEQLYDWPVSTGIASSPTYTGEFQVLDKNENAYASQWDLWMPHFIAVYRAGGDTYNGIHALPILSSGQRLWAGTLGSPASYGCIILGIQEAETLYDWADIGVLVTIE